MTTIWLTSWGIGCIGFVFGYLLYYAVKHTDKFDINLLSAAIGAVGSQAVIAWLSQGNSNWIGPYGIGLFLGFMFYLFLTWFLSGNPTFTADQRAQIRVRSLLGIGTQPPT